MDECPVTGQSPQGCCRNPDPAVDPDYGLARKPLSAPQNLVTLAPLLLSATIRWQVRRPRLKFQSVQEIVSEPTKCERSRSEREPPDGRRIVVARRLQPGAEHIAL